MLLAGRRALASEVASEQPSTPSERLAAWLLHSGVQRRDGEHRGGVTGTLDSTGRARYVYPEITGYYLQWLASRAYRGESAARLAARANEAQMWLSRWIVAAPTPLTRVHLDAAVDDWRNDAAFAFDQAMVLRGLASAAEQRLLVPDAALVERLCAALSRLVDDDGLLRACVLHRANAAIPIRWSTQRGPFLAKAAAGIVMAARTLAISPELRRAADATLAASLDWALDHPHGHTHALLYTMEGALGDAGQSPPLATIDGMVVQLKALLERTSALGFVPEDAGRNDVRRLDIVAQALRAIVLLRRHGREVDATQTYARQLSAKLRQNVHADGGIPFDFERSPGELNAWTAMFSEQALAWLAMSRDAASPTDPYIV
jgi:hypothetical protein